MREPPFAAAALAAALMLLSRGAAAQAPQATACTPPPAETSAESLLAAGRYWHALRAAPVVGGARGALDPDSALLAIRVAEGVGEFGRIDAILRRVRGADTIPALLAAAARQDERRQRWFRAAAGYRHLLAMPHAEPELRAAAVVRAALALEHLGSPEAGAAWREAAEALPVLADWFAVQRAELERDTGSALAALALAETRGARQVADSLLARRREAAGDLGGALTVYLKLGGGSALDVARLELGLGDGATARALVDSLLDTDPGSPEAWDAARFLASRFGRPTVPELLALGRVWAAHGRLRIAERWVRRAVLPRDTTLAPRLALAGILSREGRASGALAVLDEAVRLRRRPAAAPPSLTLARVQVLGAAGQWAVAGALASQLGRSAPGDSDAAAALLLVARHMRAVGALEQERAFYAALLERFAATPAAAQARFQVALADYVAGRRDSAAALLGAPGGDGASGEARAWRYWRARIALERRDPAGAAGLRALAAENPADFYGVRARELLGEPLALAPDTTIPLPLGPAYPASRARERIVLLAKTGLDDEARAEAMGWLRTAGTPASLLVEVAGAAAAMGFGREAILLAEAARRRAGLTRQVAQALFPFMYRSVIEAEATEQCVDPLLMAGIIRQESRFDPMALSRAGARGMSQLLPVTGAELSRRLRLGPWNPRLLYVPDFNLHLGAVYVSDRERRDSLALYALIASYIAGRSGVLRLRGRAAFHDVDLFVERLSAGGIRDYVRNVYANYAWYRRLYGPTAPPQ